MIDRRYLLMFITKNRQKLRRYDQIVEWWRGKMYTFLKNRINNVPLLLVTDAEDTYQACCLFYSYVIDRLDTGL